MTRQPAKAKKAALEEVESEEVDLEEVDGYVSAADLFGQISDDEDYHIPGVGMIRIRGLSRDAAHRVTNEDDPRKREMIMVQEAVVIPKLTWKAVEAWFAAPAAGQIQSLVLYITKLSGLDEQAEADDVDRFRPEPE